MRRLVTSLSILLLISYSAFAQAPRQQAENTAATTRLDAATLSEVAQTFAQVLADDYAYADKGQKMAEVIREKLKSGAYDKINSPSEFAAALDADARSVVDDRHLRVGFSSSSGQVRMRSGPMSPERLAQMRKENAAVPEVKIFEGNIGYMPVNGMMPAQAGNDAIAAAFAFLHNTDALIIDLRANPGGSGYAEVYMSYLSEGAPYVTGSVHWRKDNRVQVFKTTDMGAASYGAKKPVFVLTSHQTFSAAEGLAYQLQAFKRATIVGETTGAGANPSAGGGMVQLGHGFVANVPTGYVVSAATGGNWEGVGVKPEVALPAEDALGKVWSLAAGKLKATAADSSDRSVLDALSQATLDGTPTFTDAQLVGQYAQAVGNNRRDLTIAQRDGKLYLQRVLTINGSRQAIDILLLPAGGDRFTPASAPYGSSSLTFFKRDGKTELLLSDRTGPSIWSKQ